MNVQLTDAEQEALFDAGWKQLQEDLLEVTANNKLLSIEQTGYPAYFTPEEAAAVGLVYDPAFADIDWMKEAIYTIMERSEGSENNPANYPEYYEAREK